MMKNIYSYRVYLLISLMSLLTGVLLNVFQGDTDSEKFALVAFFFFSTAVVVVAFEELFSSRSSVMKKIKSFSRIWKK